MKEGHKLHCVVQIHFEPQLRVVAVWLYYVLVLVVFSLCLLKALYQADCAPYPSLSSELEDSRTA